jgi:hypothetical protein
MHYGSSRIGHFEVNWIKDCTRNQVYTLRRTKGIVGRYKRLLRQPQNLL